MRTRQRGKDESRRLLVVPHVGTGPVAASRLIVAPLEAVEFAVRGAESSVGAQGREVAERRVQRRRRQGGRFHCSREAAAALLERRELLRRVPSHFPGVRESLAIIVPHHRRLLLFLGRRPSATLRRAVGEMPGEEKGHGGFAARRHRLRDGNRTHRTHRGRVAGQRAVIREVVPEGQRPIPPLRALPPAQVRNARLPARPARPGTSSLSADRSRAKRDYP